MTFEWGSVLLAWTTIVFALGLLVFVGCVVAFTVETRRLRMARADVPAPLASRSRATSPAASRAAGQPAPVVTSNH